MSMGLLTNLKRVHIIGVAGTLMGSFAAFLKRAGIEVSGSDQNVYPPMSDVLKNAGVKIFEGYRAENLSSMASPPDLVVIGNVISAGNPEARYAIDQKLSYSSLPEAMERFMLADTRNVVISGTHGKTTTSSLMAHVLKSCGKDPCYFIGGVPADLPHSFHISDLAKGRPFVLEGDEYDTAFWDKVPKFNHYLPDDVILTSIEFDHADIYKDLDAVVSAFLGLMQRVRPGGRVIACEDYENVRQVVKNANVPVIFYGAKDLKNLKYTEQGSEFQFDGQTIRVPMSGQYNALNALAVWIEARELGLDPHSVLGPIANFQGVKRRQELRGEARGVQVYDDFAHHPTAVRETLVGFRKRFPQKKLTVIFEPRSATSRRNFFQKDYADAFAEADQTWIAPPYDTSKIPEGQRFSSDQLVADLNARGKKAFLMPEVDQAVPKIVSLAQSGDLIIVLSNGGFGGLIGKLLDALKSH